MPLPEAKTPHTITNSTPPPNTTRSTQIYPDRAEWEKSHDAEFKNLTSIVHVLFYRTNVSKVASYLPTLDVPLVNLVLLTLINL